MLSWRGILLAVLPVWPFCTGCQAPPKADGPTETVVLLSDREVFADRVLTLLREHDLNPDLVDREQGVAITEPSTGGQWFEVWRSDVHGAYQNLESSMHTIRRTVRVDWQPAAASPSRPAAAEEHRLAVQVDKERFSSPERQVTSTSGALGIYSERLPTREGLLNARQRGDHWVEIGRDPLLERYLLGRLAELARAPAPPAAPEPAPAASRPAATPRPAPPPGSATPSASPPPARPGMQTMEPVRSGSTPSPRPAQTSPGSSAGSPPGTMQPVPR